MSKERRVRDLAKELGYRPQELVTKIIDLGIMAAGSVNVMTKLNEDEVSQVKRDLKKSAKSSKAVATPETSEKSAAKPSSSSDSESAAAPPGPVKRRKSDKKKASAPVAIAAGEETESVGPVMIRRSSKSRTRHVVGSEEPTSTSATPDASASSPTITTVTRTSETTTGPVKEPVVQEAAVEATATEDAESAQPVASDVTPETESVVSTEAEPAVQEVEAQVATPEAAEPATESGEQEDTSPAEPEKPAVTEDKARVLGVVEINQRARSPERAAPSRPSRRTASAPAAAPAPKDGKSAQVLGTIDLDTMQSRMEGRDFGPPDASSEKSDRRDRRNKKHRDRDRQFGDRRQGGRGGRQVRDMDSFYRGSRNKRKKQVQKKTEITTAAEHKRVVRIEDTITVGDLGRQMGVKAGMLALKLMEMGMMANVNTTLDFETAQLVAMEFNHTVENVAFDIANFYDTQPDPEDTLKSRPPVVTVMGHVDHGKTSLLDAIRSADVISTEAGGITQHIGAYTVHTSAGGLITFLDTPGHEAFTALRARGAQATDIVVLVVAADDGVMPQTVEAINHSRDAGVEIIVAVNKIDKPAANVMRIKQALMEYELIAEEFGGDTPFLEVSAKQGTNITSLIEEIALRAEVAELTANPDRDAQGIVIESQLDVGRGPLATVLVQRGTLSTGDIVVIGEHYGRVRTMTDHRHNAVEAASPSIPVEITGLDGVPEAGEPFFVVKEERIAKSITTNVANQRRHMRMAALSKSGMEKLLSVMSEGGVQRKLKVIIKADVQGSIEALRQSFEKIGNDEVSVEVIHSAVGGITNNDVNLGASSDDAVVIIGFNVRPDPRAVEAAEKYDVQIMTFTIIYDAIDQIRGLVEGMLNPIQEEKTIGQAEVRETFQAPKVGTIAGCYVTSGLLRRNAKARLWRDGKLVYESTLGSLRRFKDNVTEVKSGFECGTSLENYNDIKIGDVIEAYEIIEVAAKL